MGKVRYTVIIEWDPEEKLYIATIPALSIGSYGDTVDEAMVMIQEAAEVTIEGLKGDGQPIPQGDEGKVALANLSNGMKPWPKN